MSEASSTEDIRRLEERYLSPATRIPFPPVVAVSGSGAEFVDIEGRRFLDLHSMACITNTGHAHPRVVEAIRAQAERILHCNPAYVLHENTVRLAERLAALTPGSFDKRVAFGLSGSDANDGALKLVRAATGRPKVVSFFGAYHGSTYGALSLSAVSLAMRRGFGPMVPDVHHIPFPNTYRPDPARVPEEVTDYCLARLDELLGTVAPPEEVAAVFVEPIQGDSGILVPPSRFLAELLARCRRHGILAVAEEVQTGMGRTGLWFASESFPEPPDVVVIGKALGSGLPISALVARSELMDAWGPPGHVFSTSANPVCSAAALATLDTIEEEGLLSRASRIGELLETGFREMASRHESIGNTRGRGLMLGVDLVVDRETRMPDRNLAAKAVWRAHQLGVYLTFLSDSVLRIAPPLVLTEAQAQSALDRLDQALEDARRGMVSDEQSAAVRGW